MVSVIQRALLRLWSPARTATPPPLPGGRPRIGLAAFAVLGLVAGACGETAHFRGAYIGMPLSEFQREVPAAEELEPEPSIPEGVVAYRESTEGSRYSGTYYFSEGRLAAMDVRFGKDVEFEALERELTRSNGPAAGRANAALGVRGVFWELDDASMTLIESPGRAGEIVLEEDAKYLTDYTVETGPNNIMLLIDGRSGHRGLPLLVASLGLFAAAVVGQRRISSRYRQFLGRVRSIETERDIERLRQVAYQAVYTVLFVHVCLALAGLVLLQGAVNGDLGLVGVLLVVAAVGGLTYQNGKTRELETAVMGRPAAEELQGRTDRVIQTWKRKYVPPGPWKRGFPAP